MALLSAQNVSKSFPGVRALSGVSVDFQAGSVHALMGENGAGKSTLGKILAGVYRPDGGEILWEGKPVRFGNPRDALRTGVAIVHQELLFAENLTVADNLSLGDLPNKGPWIDERAMIDRAAAWLAEVGSNIDPRTRLGDLSVSKQQLVQIAGGVGRGAKVLVFDEPTAALSNVEALRLLDLIRRLRADGITCIYVSHRLDEIFAVCDEVTVLRDGAKVGTRAVADTSRADLVRMMIGRELGESVETAADGTGPVRLRVSGLSSPGKFNDISLEVRAGEIVGLAGLVGAGRTEVVEAIFGLDPHVKGTIEIDGKKVSPGSPAEAMAAGFGLVPEDRKRHGLVLGMSARANISLPILQRLARASWINDRHESTLADGYFQRLRVKAPSQLAIAKGLSGGNQQKLVIAKWLAADANVLLIDEPTRGVDVGAKAEIHALLRELAASGKAILVVSSDLPELRAISDRLIVMREGRAVAENPARTEEETIMRQMTGV